MDPQSNPNQPSQNLPPAMSPSPGTSPMPASNLPPATATSPDFSLASSNLTQNVAPTAEVRANQQAATATTQATNTGAVTTDGQPAAVGSADNPSIPKVVETPISTQSTLLISELRDGLVIMKDGSFRAVVACQSINFDLMSEVEREGIEFSYQNFLNSLTFNIQILVRSQRVDIGPYIDHLSKIRRDNDNMLLGVLMDDYIDFIDELSQRANIMDKSFFIVIPYYSSADAEKLLTQTKNLFRGFSKKPPEVTRINRETYNTAVDELNKRVESVVSGLFQIGVRSVRLGTRELSELYYNFNNPDTAVREPLVDFTQLATTYVRKGDPKDGQAK